MMLPKLVRVRAKSPSFDDPLPLVFREFGRRGGGSGASVRSMRSGTGCDLLEQTRRQFHLTRSLLNSLKILIISGIDFHFVADFDEERNRHDRAGLDCRWLSAA